MTTIFPFQPTAQTPPFQFQPTLDSAVYTGIVMWNVTGQRWYLSLYDLSNNLIFSLPLIGSPTGSAIESISWLEGIVTVVTDVPHGFLQGAVVNLVIAGCAPVALNGNISAFIIDEVTFEYSLASDPGGATALGTATYNINLAGGYFTTSTLVFREASQQLEVSP
jgi:hypothetical protein